MAEQPQEQEPWTLEKQLAHLQAQQTKAQEAVVKLQGAIELVQGIIAQQTPPEAPAE